MRAEVIKNLRKHFFDNFTSPWTKHNWEWMEKYCKIEGNKFDINFHPWLREVYEAIEDPEVNVVVMEAAAGTYKTGVLDTIIPWWVINNTGKILRINPVDEVAKDFTKTRIVPLLENCPPVAALFQGKKVRATNGLITFPQWEADRVHVKASGASEKIQHGYSCKFLLIDDAQQIDEPFDVLFKRVRKNYGNTKIVICATGGEQRFSNNKLVGDELAMLVNSGKIYRRAWKCPACLRYQQWKWSEPRNVQEGQKQTYSGVNWGDTVKNADGTINFDKTSNNAKLECHHCCHKLDDTKLNRIQLEETAIYQCIKEDGNPKIKTFRWPVFVASDNSFKDACNLYLQAKELEQARIFDKSKAFYQQVLGEEWSNKISKSNNKLVYQKFDSNAEWPEEKFRFMGVDLQGDGRRYYMVVAFDGIGNGRVITYGVCHSWFEIERVAIDFKVQQPSGKNAHFVGIDCGYDWGKVAKESVLHGETLTFNENGYEWKEHFGWLCLRGDQKPHYTWADGINRAVSEQSDYETMPDHPPARCHFWSNKAVKNLVASIRDGFNKLQLGVNTQDEGLQRQLNSEHPDEYGDWKPKVQGNENHLWDCLCECYAMGILAGIPFFGLETIPKS